MKELRQNIKDEKEQNIADELSESIKDAVWVAKALFDRNKVTGSAANLSFRLGESIYISGSGTCFGRLSAESFAAIDLEGKLIKENSNRLSANKISPSKEYPIHLMIYQQYENVRAVIHTHSFYSTLWSCLPDINPDDALPSITPYLQMKVGKIALVPYARPGSEELFDFMRSRLQAGDGFLLANHGPVIAGSSILDAFYGIEELEESARIAWHLRAEKFNLIR